LAESLFRISAYVAERGLIVGGPYQAARDLLLNAAPRTAGQPLHRDSETAVEAAVRICKDLGQKPAEMEEAQPRLAFARSNKDLFAALGNTAMVGAGTPWVWAAPEAFEIVDVLRARRLGDEIAPRSVAQQLRYCAAARRRVALTPPRSAGWRCRSSNQRRNASHKYHRSVVRKAGRKSSGEPRPPR